MANEKIHQGRVFTLWREEVTLPNHRKTILDTVRHPGAAAIMAFTEKNEVLLLNQFRHAAGGYLWEIPAGTLEPGEDPETCAARELTEETGYAAKDLAFLATITPVPGYSTEKIHLYLAKNLTEKETNLDADEVLTLHKVPHEKALEMARQGQITDAKTLCALFFTQNLA